VDRVHTHPCELEGAGLGAEPFDLVRRGARLERGVVDEYADSRSERCSRRLANRLGSGKGASRGAGLFDRGVPSGASRSMVCFRVSEEGSMTGFL